MFDRQAIADLYDRQASRLYALALRITGDPDAAADALADAFEALSRNDDVRDPETWLFRATRDQALARQTQKRPATVVPKAATPRQLVEDAWYGMTVNDLVNAYSISEADVRGMLCAGMRELRGKLAAGTQ